MGKGGEGKRKRKQGVKITKGRQHGVLHGKNGAERRMPMDKKAGMAFS